MSLLRIITIVRGRTRKYFRGRTILKIAEGVTTLLSLKSTQIEAPGTLRGDMLLDDVFSRFCMVVSLTLN